jgi:antitoxin (DNA-binding transcriptional repressor) of toxin-antitoxin stability system
VDEAPKGKSFIITKAGKPMVKVTALDVPLGKQARPLGFLRGQLSIPDDIDTMGREEIERLFGTLKPMRAKNWIAQAVVASIITLALATV